MDQECYTGVHLGLYVPLAVVFLFFFCLGPPLLNAALLYRVRAALDEHNKRQVYGFMYSRYHRKYYWWDSVLMLQTIALVAVDVFGRAVVVEWQALMLLSVLIAIAMINILCGAIKGRLVRHLEFSSTSVLSLTVTLNLYYVTGQGELLVKQAGGAAIAVLVLLLNLGLIAVFVALIVRSYVSDDR
ncbi:hypothetical protein HXX76_009371 [Chlamydomonas incerta]|uniref:TRP C-terminal domain-containing protein n=1 Tax=Chlamydomonas incerta TaxID=51695 RepID=A0A835VZR0_CHLIN|nr:hypothetical protein HXX76_009371 [Chlamydomonas incerta]|eukprot:KAG2431878.1 hypothetical protein HXX76_009371 [Chlamydomonas incerta]